MTTERTTLTRWGNTLGVWLYRRSDGRLAGPGKGTTIGLLTVPGRTTGIPRTVAIGFFPHGTGYLVAGSASGARQDPQWFRNLRAAPHAHIQIGAARMDADVRIAETAERDMLWRQVILVQAPWRRRYEKRPAGSSPSPCSRPGNPGHDQSRHRRGRPPDPWHGGRSGVGCNCPTAARSPMTTAVTGQLSKSLSTTER